MHDVPGATHWHEPTGGKRAGFIHFHETRVPDDICRQDRHQPSLHPCCRHG